MKNYSAKNYLENQRKIVFCNSDLHVVITETVYKDLQKYLIK